MCRKLCTRKKGANVAELPRRQGKERNGILTRQTPVREPQRWPQELRLETVTNYTVGGPRQEEPGISIREVGPRTRPRQI